jgi:hypothetical protein
MSTETRDDTCVVCPHCGHRHSDAWERFASSALIEDECEECEKRFVGWAETRVTYRAEKVETAE